MRLQIHSLAAASVAVLFSLLPPGAGAQAAGEATSCAQLPAAAMTFAALAAEPADQLVGRLVAVDVDLAASADFAVGDDGSLRYGMLFNDVAEGWSWRPQAQPEHEDYYRWKFLPLQRRVEEGAAYVQEEMVGVPQHTRVERLNDYFLAFDNPYRFYARGSDGFVARLPAGTQSVRLVALARLGVPALAESTTFWKAVHGLPVDRTLKKRYLVGELQALIVCDADGGRELATIAPAARR